MRNVDKQLRTRMERDRLSSVRTGASMSLGTGADTSGSAELRQFDNGVRFGVPETGAGFGEPETGEGFGEPEIGFGEPETGFGVKSCVSGPRLINTAG